MSFIRLFSGCRIILPSRWKIRFSVAFPSTNATTTCPSSALFCRRTWRKTQRRSRFRHQRRFADTDTRLACHVQAGERQPAHFRDRGDACKAPRLPSHRRTQTRAGYPEHHSGRVEQNVGRGILTGVCSQSQIPAKPVFRLCEGKSVHQRQSRIGVYCQIHA